MLAQECRNFQMLLGRRSRRGTPLIVQLAASPLAGRSDPGSPCHTSLNCTACGGIVGHRGLRLGTALSLLLAKIEPDIGGQTLEQGPRIARFGLMTILQLL